MFIPGVRIYVMLNNENYMSGVGMQQFQAFPLCSVLLSNVGFSGILISIWLWILSRRMSNCVTGAELTSQRHSVTSHKTWIFCNTAVGTSNHGLLKHKPTRCHLLFYFPSYRLNLFRALIYLSSGVCNYAVELPHCSFHSWFAVCWRLSAVRAGVVSGLQAKPSACSPDTTPA